MSQISERCVEPEARAIDPSMRGEMSPAKRPQTATVEDSRPVQGAENWEETAGPGAPAVQGADPSPISPGSQRPAPVVVAEAELP